MRSQKPILLVEDDHVDVMTVERAFKELGVTNQLYIVGNGERGLEFLRDERNKKPCLIILDLKMPKMNGLEFLTIIKQDELLRELPVIVLTVSKEEQDKVESFKLNVAGYLIKPVDYQQFVDVIRQIIEIFNGLEANLI